MFFSLPDPYPMILLNLLSSLTVLSFIIIYRYLYPKKTLNPWILLLLISIPPTLNLFRNGTYRSGDITPHAIYLENFYRNLTEGTLIPQWLEDQCGGYGCPSFLFFYLLPYYIASIFHFLGVSFVDSLKLLLAISFVASGMTMYAWAKKEFGSIPGFIAALLYLFAPYHLIDVHFRGAVGETPSFAIAPLLFLATKYLFEKARYRYAVYVTVLCSLLLLSHSSTTLTFFPVLGAYILFLMRKIKKNKILLLSYFCLAVIFGFLLVSFYAIPASIEVKNSWYYAYFRDTGDFKPFWEYIVSPARFGFLFQGNQGEYRLLIGYSQLMIVVFSLLLLIRKKIPTQYTFFHLVLLSLFSLYFLMMLPIAKPIWDTLPLLKTFYVVWRFLVPISFITATIGAIVFFKKNNTLLIYFICLFTIFSTILNWGNRKMVPYNPQSYLYNADSYTEYFEPNNPLFENSYEKLRSHIGAIIYQRPKAPLTTLEGDVIYKQITRTSVHRQYLMDVKKDSTIQENTNYFPGWTVLANNQPISIDYKDPQHLGKIVYTLPKGLYKVDIQFGNTQIRDIAKIISLTALAFLIIFTFIIYGIMKVKTRTSLRFLLPQL